MLNGYSKWKGDLNGDKVFLCQKMVWGDGEENREDILTPNQDNTATFSMTEKIRWINVFNVY